MESRDFCYWLQGYFEILGEVSLSEEQTTIVQNHLNMVFAHAKYKENVEDKEDSKFFGGVKPVMLC